MTISPWLIYFASQMDNVISDIDLFALIAFFIGVIWALMNAYYYFNHENDTQYCDCHLCVNQINHKNKNITWKFIKPCIIIFCCAVMLDSVLPSTPTVYKMLIIPTAVNSIVVQKLPAELQQFIDKELKVKTEDK